MRARVAEMLRYKEREYVEAYNRLAAWLHERDWEGVLKGRCGTSSM
jgi:hypothetical protein